MRAGELRYWLTLYEPTQTTNDYGESVTTYVERKMIRAERVKLTGARRDEAGEVWADYSAQYNIRDVHKVEEGWRVCEPGGRLMVVRAILPNRARAYKTLVTERVNE